MARMTLSQLEDEIRNWIPDKLSAPIKSAANLVLRDLGRKGITPLLSRVSFTTTPTDTSPTVSVSQGSTSVTVDTGTFPTSNDGQVIQIAGGDHWFVISNTVANTSFTISSAFPDSTVSGGSVVIAYPRVVLPTDILSIEQIREPNRPPLTRIVGEVEPEISSNPTTTRPTSYIEIVPQNTDGKLEIWLIDYPDDRYTYIVEGRRRLTLFTTSGSTSGLPEEFEDVLVAGVLSFLWSQEDSEGRGAYWRSMYEKLARDARSRRGPIYQGRIGRVGDVPLIGVNLPELATDLIS